MVKHKCYIGVVMLYLYNSQMQGLEVHPVDVSKMKKIRNNVKRKNHSTKMLCIQSGPGQSGQQKH